MSVNTKDMAIVIFHDKQGNVFVQERGENSKVGEKFAFWGGGIDERETPKQALIRELREELRYVPEKFVFWKIHSFIMEEGGKYNGWLISLHTFFSPAPEGLENFKVYEGKGIVKMNLSKAASNSGFHAKDRELLQSLKAALDKENINLKKFLNKFADGIQED